jgi:hypothetical protein
MIAAKLSLLQTLLFAPKPPKRLSDRIVDFNVTVKPSNLQTFKLSNLQTFKPIKGKDYFMIR